MIKTSDCVWVWRATEQRYDAEIIALVSGGDIITEAGETIDASDAYSLDEVHTYDVSFVGSDKEFTLYARSMQDAIRLARVQLELEAGQMGMFPAEVNTVEELRLY